VRIKTKPERINAWMNEPNLSFTSQIQIKVRGHLDSRWQEWFDRLTIDYDPEQDISLLSGNLPDQAALVGILNQLNHMNVTFISVIQTTKEKQTQGTQGAIK
jgi:hypothetical protein